MLDADAAIVAGGAARRLGGATKPFLEVDGRPVIERQLEVLSLLFARIMVIANDPAPFARLGLPVFPDAIPGKGAPGGVYTALERSLAPAVLCIAGDMPFIGAGPIELLVRSAQGFDAAAPLRGGRPEPLFAVYGRRCLEPFGRALRAGDPSLRELLASVRTRLIPEEEWGRVDPGGRALENLNTAEDLARLRG